MTNDELLAQISSNNSDVTVVVFTAPWCISCKPIKNLLSYLESKYSTIHSIIIDVEKDQALAKKHGVGGLPTGLIYKDNKWANRMSGVQVKVNLVESKIMGLIEDPR